MCPNSGALGWACWPRGNSSTDCPSAIEAMIRFFAGLSSNVFSLDLACSYSQTDLSRMLVEPTKPLCNLKLLLWESKQLGKPALWFTKGLPGLPHCFCLPLSNFKQDNGSGSRAKSGFWSGVSLPQPNRWQRQSLLLWSSRSSAKESHFANQKPMNYESGLVRIFDNLRTFVA